MDLESFGREENCLKLVSQGPPLCLMPKIAACAIFLNVHDFENMDLALYDFQCIICVKGTANVGHVRAFAA